MQSLHHRNLSLFLCFFWEKYWVPLVPGLIRLVSRPRVSSVPKLGVDVSRFYLLHPVPQANHLPSSIRDLKAVPS